MVPAHRDARGSLAHRYIAIYRSIYRRDISAQQGGSMFHEQDAWFDCGPGRKGWDGFEPFMKGWFWTGGGRRGGPFRGGRIFEQGDLKYVILQLLEEKPRHGYEVIKALEERF